MVDESGDAITNFFRSLRRTFLDDHINFLQDGLSAGWELIDVFIDSSDCSVHSRQYTGIVHGEYKKIR